GMTTMKVKSLIMLIVAFTRASVAIDANQTSERRRHPLQKTRKRGRARHSVRAALGKVTSRRARKMEQIVWRTLRVGVAPYHPNHPPFEQLKEWKCGKIASRRRC